MAVFSVHQLAFAFGLLGNIVSFLVFLAPLPTFYRIFKKKSTEGFQSVPCVVALFSSMLLLYYGLLKTNGMMIITINSIGCIIEATYLIIYMVYAPKAAKISTMKMLIFFNLGAYGLIILLTVLLANGSKRIKIVGWICATFSVSVFAAPLSILRQVIRTKSVEYMPFPLSLCLTFSAIMWFFYGLLIKDFFIALPNVLGFGFGVVQMILYVLYKKKDFPKPDQGKMDKNIELIIEENPKIELVIAITKLGDGNMNQQVEDKPREKNGCNAYRTYKN